MTGNAAAVGFSVHTGWAAAVVVAGPALAPRILERRRIALAESDDTVEAEVYHRAAELSPKRAAAFVRQAEKSAARRASAAIRSLSESYPLAAAGFQLSAVNLPTDLAAILRSHPLVHSAEGVLYREALAGAAEGCGLEIVRIPRRELGSRFASALGTGGEKALAWLSTAGRNIGPPWAKDQKDAAMAAIVALTAARTR